MGDVFTTLDLLLFFGILIGVMAVGLIAGWKEETSEDYFLAGRKIPWWGVAGSIFGSNVSANHMVGMMGVGFSIGFFQSHFEFGAILGLMVLCYGFLPVYRKLNVYTLSEYLGRRYDDRSRVAYAVIMVFIMVAVHMVPALYIGSRTICVLLGGDAVETVAAATTEVEGAAQSSDPESAKTQQNVRMPYYIAFVMALALISAAYTILGGLKAVVWTDFLQSILLLGAGILVAALTFNAVGGWGEMMSLDRAEDFANQKMHLYLPSNHADLPWSGVLTGLFAMHCFYWGTNQFIVQRALAARSDHEAKVGIVAAGFLKLLIPFFSISAGTAAFYLFRERMPDRTIAPDAAFPELVKLIVPTQFGIIGLIAAGLIGAILSSIDSMMNSAATIVTIDIYKKYINPNATDPKLIRVGRLSIVAFVVFAALMAIFVHDPNSDENFFLKIVDYSSYLTPGLLVAFAMGMFWRRATGSGAIVTMIAGIVFSGVVVFAYDNYLGKIPEVVVVFGTKLNFFHRAVVVILLCIAVHVVVSLMTRPDSEKSRFVWTDLGGHSAGDLSRLAFKILISIGVFIFLGASMSKELLSPTASAIFAAVWTLGMFAHRIYQKNIAVSDSSTVSNSPVLLSILRDDITWAGLLCSAAVFMHFYFY